MHSARRETGAGGTTGVTTVRSGARGGTRRGVARGHRPSCGPFWPHFVILPFPSWHALLGSAKRSRGAPGHGGDDCDDPVQYIRLGSRREAAYVTGERYVCYDGRARRDGALEDARGRGGAGSGARTGATGAGGGYGGGAGTVDGTVTDGVGYAAAVGGAGGALGYGTTVGRKRVDGRGRGGTNGDAVGTTGVGTWGGRGAATRTRVRYGGRVGRGAGRDFALALGGLGRTRWGVRCTRLTDGRYVRVGRGGHRYGRGGRNVRAWAARVNGDVGLRYGGWLGGRGGNKTGTAYGAPGARGGDGRGGGYVRGARGTGTLERTRRRGPGRTRGVAVGGRYGGVSYGGGWRRGRDDTSYVGVSVRGTGRRTGGRRLLPYGQATPTVTWTGTGRTNCGFSYGWGDGDGYGGDALVDGAGVIPGDGLRGGGGDARRGASDGRGGGRWLGDGGATGVGGGVLYGRFGGGRYGRVGGRRRRVWGGGWWTLIGGDCERCRPGLRRLLTAGRRVRTATGVLGATGPTGWTGGRRGTDGRRSTTGADDAGEDAIGGGRLVRWSNAADYGSGGGDGGTGGGDYACAGRGGATARRRRTLGSAVRTLGATDGDTSEGWAGGGTAYAAGGRRTRDGANLRGGARTYGGGLTRRGTRGRTGRGQVERHGGWDGAGPSDGRG
ncbi:uncharacterized protein LOC128980496 [Indicator indicator]|uniref:uncharacterized protein LOC128980496 n=1 Tax=Indicator indicator TaxID=1002788 RepID=UPI0023DF1CA4|nr:uncharacterized protein LOC128980496 [Indicator indicator]